MVLRSARCEEDCMTKAESFGDEPAGHQFGRERSRCVRKTDGEFDPRAPWRLGIGQPADAPQPSLSDRTLGNRGSCGLQTTDTFSEGCFIGGYVAQICGIVRRPLVNQEATCLTVKTPRLHLWCWSLARL